MALDAPERQVLIDYYGDADHFFWHQRVRVVHLGPPGVWTALIRFATARTSMEIGSPVRPSALLERFHR